MAESMLFPDSPILRLAWLKRLSGGGGADESLIYRLPQPTVFNGTAADPIDSGVALLPTSRAMTVEIDLTPGSFTARKFAFYAGMYTSPYYWIGLEFRNNAWAVAMYESKISLTNLSAGKRCRVVIRKQADSNEVEASCYDGSTLVSGSVTDSRLTSENPMIVGGYQPNSNTMAFIGTISEFSAYSRAKSDAEVNRFLYGLT